MRLGHLVEAATAVARRSGSPEAVGRLSPAPPAAAAPDGPTADPEVRAVVADSRQVVPGALFCCVVGSHHDGHDHAAAAVAAGAASLVVQRPLGLGVPEVVAPSVRAAVGPLASAFNGDPSGSLDVVGITGTNGKTTTVAVLAAVLEACGRPTTVLGTLSGPRTTPEAPELQATLAAARDRGDRAVAMEVSSHALALHRVDGTRFAVGVFTNLGVDHLDLHGNREAYFAAKARLFEPGWSQLAVIDVDDPWGRLLAAVRPDAVTVSLGDAADLVVAADGSRFRWRGHPVELRLPGRFNVSNVLAAAAAAAALGVPDSDVAAALGVARAPRGRLEPVDAGQPFSVLVDYAHTPDGLRTVLATARELAGGHRVHVVFGCGGDRDRSKRPLMARAAVEGADVVVVTSDNPRSEEPGAIVAEALAGLDDPGAVTVELDRRAAIARALGGARPGDLVVIAGKGHETTQEQGGRREPFDDRVVAAEELAALGWRPGAALAEDGS